MKKKIASALVLALAASVALAQEPIMYPNKGQSLEQLEKDKFECYQWAKKQADFDPLDQPVQNDPIPPRREEPRESPGVGTAKGAVGGALLGAGLGALLGGRRGALTGSVIGGVGGAVVGSRQGRADSYEDARRDAIERKRGEANYLDEKRDVYNRAFEACLEGRGYTIK